MISQSFSSDFQHLTLSRSYHQLANRNILVEIRFLEIDTQKRRHKRANNLVNLVAHSLSSRIQNTKKEYNSVDLEKKRFWISIVVHALV